MGKQEKVDSQPRLSGHTILAMAILVSLAWHLFWISAVKVVASPLKGAAGHFSKVTFLGPILPRVIMEVRAQAVPRSFLERRYNVAARKAEESYGEGDSSTPHVDDLRVGGYRLTPSVAKQSEKRLIGLIEDAVNGDKSASFFGAD